jgi:hypothetical protein
LPAPGPDGIHLFFQNGQHLIGCITAIDYFVSKLHFAAAPERTKTHYVPQKVNHWPPNQPDTDICRTENDYNRPISFVTVVA